MKNSQARLPRRLLDLIQREGALYRAKNLSIKVFF
jgi:hypothetical protein